MIDENLQDSIDHLFRHRWGQMVAVLVRIFGIEKIDQIEDAVQDALIVAMKKWPFGGVPANPTAWLIQTAKNRMIDRLRRSSRDRDIDESHPAKTPDDPIRFASELEEDQLQMIFACCHSSIPADSQVALTLKTVSGFSIAEIARAYLANSEAVAKMITRAKAKLRDGNIRLELPAGSDLNERLDTVLRVLYLMFNEGYSASGGDELLRNDLCYEAIRLVRIIAHHPITDMPKVHAAAALFMFQATRIPARTDKDGSLQMLLEQDRSKWDVEMLSAGLEHFGLSAKGDEISTYHLEAEIASLHALSPNYDATDWPRMLEAYDKLLERRFSPIVALNRAVVVGELNGPQAALDELSSLAEHYLMTSFNLYHSTRAYFMARLGRIDQSIESYRRALKLTRNEALRRFFSNKIENIGTRED